MSLVDPTFVESDGMAWLRVQFLRRDGKTPLSLDGLTAHLRFRVLDRADYVAETATILYPTAERSMTIVAPATSGVAEYNFAESELVAGEQGGILEWESWAEDQTGKRLTTLVKGQEWIRAKIPGGT